MLYIVVTSICTVHDPILICTSYDMVRVYVCVCMCVCVCSCTVKWQSRAVYNFYQITRFFLHPSSIILSFVYNSGGSGTVPADLPQGETVRFLSFIAMWPRVPEPQSQIPKCSRPFTFLYVLLRFLHFLVQ